MLKRSLYALSLLTALCSCATVGQARQIDVWGHPFSVGDDRGSAPVSPKFNSLAGERDRGDQQLRPLDDDLGR